jgi:hypothetical protein
VEPHDLICAGFVLEVWLGEVWRGDEWRCLASVASSCYCGEVVEGQAGVAVAWGWARLWWLEAEEWRRQVGGRCILPANAGGRRIYSTSGWSG